MQNTSITYYGSFLAQPNFYVFGAAILVAIIAGILGCFIVWRKMSYFGDSLSHSALLGIVFGILSGISMNIAVIITCAAFAGLIVYLQQKKIFANDTILGILAHSAIAIGITALGIIKYKYYIDEHSLLFGQLFKITASDFNLIFIGSLIVLVAIINLWGKLVLTSINEDLAQGEGINTLRTHLFFTLLITMVVALSIKVVGILLVTSLMIIPAASARQFSRSPKQMALLSSLFGVVAAILGIMLSTKLAVSTGPMIVVCSSAIFFTVTIFSSFRK